MSRFGKCPKCKSDMEIITIYDARNDKGRHLDAEFTVCSQCSFPMLRVVKTGRWQVVVASDGTATEMAL